jgi:hypothetical protein
MTTLMNYRPDELSELQSPLLASRAALERSQIAGLHDRWGSSLPSSGLRSRTSQLAAALEPRNIRRYVMPNCDHPHVGCAVTLAGCAWSARQHGPASLLAWCMS